MKPEEVDPGGPGEMDDPESADSDNVYEDDDNMTDKAASDAVDANGEPKKKYDPKDPLRPRRKKARRACFACQRAHLTCGDERPCQRCIKRGLAGHCEDGVRKKAKYLHDTPNEQLRQVLGPHVDANTPSLRPNPQRHGSADGTNVSTVGSFFAQPSPQFPGFASPQPPMGPLAGQMQFGGQQSPVSPTFQGPGAPLMGPMGLPQGHSPPGMAGFSPTGFDPYALCLDGFSNHFAQSEFDFLGQLSSSAAGNPPQDPSLAPPENGGLYGLPGVFGNGLGQFDNNNNNNLMDNYTGLGPSPNGMYPQGSLQHGFSHAFAIAAAPTSLQSPSTENNSPQPIHGLDVSPTVPAFGPAMLPGSRQQTSLSRPRPKTPGLARPGQQSVLGKRTRDPSYIYETVKVPFPYVKSFHGVLQMLRARFRGERLQRIAQALALIRPSFISCTKTLNTADLVFMEKCFQRALIEYEEFLHQCPSPALVCRRTGEVACVNKEFTALTGWTKDVLLGKVANLNINKGATAGSSDSSTSKPGPTLALNNHDAAKPAEGQGPVFLFELLDDDSVIDFYDDFAGIAFTNSRGKVVKKCHLVKYRTKESAEGGGSNGQEPTPPTDPRSNSILSHRVAKIDGEHGISRLEKGGKLACTYTWFVKRDTFDIPMMIVINFLPSYSKEDNKMAV